MGFEISGSTIVDQSRQLLSVGVITATSLDISGNVDIDGHTELDYVNIAGVSTFSDTVEIPSDSKKILLGADKEMQVLHDGTESLIKDTRNSGTVKIQADNFRVIDKDSSQTMLSAEVDDAVDLYFNGSKKFETHNTGIRVTGIATVTSTIYVNVNGSSIAENNLNFASSGKAYIDHRTTSQDIDFRVSHGSALDRTAITVGSAGITTFYDTPHDDIGSLRSIPLQDESSTANYVLVASDAGQCVHAHSSTTQVTVNPSVFSAGDAVSIVNGSSGNITLTQGTSMTIRNTADSSTGSKTLASFGMCTLWFSGHNVAYLSGAGLS